MLLLSTSCIFSYWILISNLDNKLPNTFTRWGDQCLENLLAHQRSLNLIYLGHAIIGLCQFFSILVNKKYAFFLNSQLTQTMNNLNLGTEDKKYLKNYKTKQNKTKPSRILQICTTCTYSTWNIRNTSEETGNEAKVISK